LLSKARKYLLIAIVAGLISYSIIFLVIYRGSINKFIEIVSRGDPVAALFAAMFRASALIMHGVTFFVLLYALSRDMRLMKVIQITSTSIFVEFIAPVGGITEVAKIYFLKEFGVASVEEAYAAVAMHRILLTGSVTAATVVSLYVLNAPLLMWAVLVLPALGLLAANTAILLAPTSSRVEHLIVSLSRRFGHDLQGFSGRYREVFRKLLSAKKYLLLALVMAFGERLANAVFGVATACILGLRIPVWEAVIIFDSLQTIIWLLPAITPGGVGIYELLQTLLATWLGITPDTSAALAIMTRALFIVGEYPIFVASTMALGLSLKKVASLAEKDKGTIGAPMA